MTTSKFEARKKRAIAIAKKLEKILPHAKIALNFHNDWEMLVAVILSAQTTDKKVNEVTQTLFKKYKTLNDYARAPFSKFSNDIKTIGLYRGKAKNILATAKVIKEKYHGKLPSTMGELIELPGVGRKTANVVLGVAHNIVEGITVDTHVRRFAIKFDLTDSKDPKIIEQDLMKLLPKKYWKDISYRFIDYGRSICPANKHECENHPLTKIYPEAAHRWPKAK